MGLVCRATLALLLTCVAGCHHAAMMPLLAVGPLHRGDAGVLDEALDAARASGHPSFHSDLEHGRFVVHANSDPSRRARFVVQCSRDGYVTITPEGDGVVREGDRFTMPREMRDEYAELAVVLERAIPEER